MEAGTLMNNEKLHISDFYFDAVANKDLLEDPMQALAKKAMETHAINLEKKVRASMKRFPWNECIILRDPMTPSAVVTIGKRSLWNYIVNKYRLWRYAE
jgi:hypothetical protein